ncbi:MAG: hypothetical protein F4X65_07945 [Chloroflexi bacterium]|nr:hypothetical protein [Chloroflexota bacterium]
MGLLTILLLLAGNSDFRPTELEAAMAPYRYSIVAWELNHLSHKWARNLENLWSQDKELSQEDRAALLKNFFEWGRQQQELESSLAHARLSGGASGAPAGNESPGSGTDASPDGQAGPQDMDLPPDTFAQLTRALDRNRQRREELLPRVEAIVEEELTGLLAQQGFATRWIGVFPPVDVVFGTPPTVLVLSPRDRIYRQGATLLRPGLEDNVKNELEQAALETEDLSAIVERTGGLSVYPSVVLDTAGLSYALEATAHEWVHHWLFFRPLGRNYRESPELLTVNETAATIAGEALGDLVYEVLTGEQVARNGTVPTPGRFDFAREMRETRRRAEELLAAGDIEGAEAYMEQRRRLFVAQGYNIRKINQAYFAFYGSYATRPGATSPVGQQLRELRSESDSLKEFLDTVAQFGSYKEYLEFIGGYSGETSE